MRTNTSRWSAATLEAAGTVFTDLQTDGAGNITITYQSPNAFAMNAIVLVVVPEPASAVLGLMGGLLLLRRRR